MNLKNPDWRPSWVVFEEICKDTEVLKTVLQLFYRHLCTSNAGDLRLTKTSLKSLFNLLKSHVRGYKLANSRIYSTQQKCLLLNKDVPQSAVYVRVDRELGQDFIVLPSNASQIAHFKYPTSSFLSDTFVVNSCYEFRDFMMLKRNRK